MSCDAVREFLLDAGWDADGRRQAAEFLRHLETCDECREATDDFDRLRAVLAPNEEPDEEVGDWDAMEPRPEIAAAQRRPFRWSRIAFTMAAAVLLALGSFEVGRRVLVPPGHTVVINATTPVDQMPRAISNLEISHDIQAFRQVSDVYEGHANWMVVSKNSSDVGISADALPATRKVLLLRLDLWQGGELLSNADLMVLAGQKADLTVPLPSGESLHYRIGTSTDEPARLMVWLELNTKHGGEPLAALATNLRLTAGQKLTAGKLATSAGDYELKIEFAGSELADDKP